MLFSCITGDLISLKAIEPSHSKYMSIKRFIGNEIFILIGLSLVTIILGGYSYGTSDHAIHIPFIKSQMDPSLYPNDPLIEQRQLNFSFLWTILAKIAQFVDLEPLFFSIYFISLFFSYFMIFHIAKL